MLDTVALMLAVAAAVGCGLLAGVYFTFSAFVNESLARIPDDAAVAAMRQVNRVILGSAFMPLFFGTPLVALAAAGCALAAWPQPAAVAAVVGAAAIVAANLGLTVFRHVPLNIALDRGTIAVWREFDTPWRRWNHLRTAGCTVAALALTAALAIR